MLVLIYPDEAVVEEEPDEACFDAGIGLADVLPHDCLHVHVRPASALVVSDLELLPCGIIV